MAGGRRDALADAIDAHLVGCIVGMFEQNQVGIRSPSPLRPWLENLVTTAKSTGDTSALDSVAPLLRQAAENVDDDGSSEEEEEEEEEEASEEHSEGHEAPGGGAEEKPEAVVSASTSGAPLVDEMSALIANLEEDDETGMGLLAPLDGTALFEVTCTMNHACVPNVLVCWPPGQPPSSWSPSSEGADTPAVPLAVEILALRDLKVGEELCFSYIAADLPRMERARALREYGIHCTCFLCTGDLCVPCAPTGTAE